MSKVDFMKEVSFEKGKSMIPAGEFVATCVGIAELGSHIDSYGDGDKEVVKLGFDFEFEEEGTTYHFPYVLNATTSEKGNLFKLLSPFFKGMKAMQPPKLLGKTGTLILTEGEFNGNPFVKFDSFKPLAGKVGEMFKGSYKGEDEVETYQYALANGENDTYQNMPAKFRFKVEQCLDNGGEGKYVDKNDSGESLPSDEEVDGAINIDDIPF